MFNAEQRDWMRMLAAMRLEDVCWCGWESVDTCARGCGPCGGEAPIAPATLADRLLVQCECGVYPARPGMVIAVHRMNCRRDHATESARNLADAYRPEGVP